MSYSLEEIKRDVRDMDCRQFYLQHILRSDNWYFENILNYSAADISKVSKRWGISRPSESSSVFRRTKSRR